MDIKEIKKTEIVEIQDILYHIEDFGHIFHYPPEKLDDPFNKILEGISEIKKLMDDSYEM